MKLQNTTSKLEKMTNKTSSKLERITSSVKSTTKNIVDSIKNNAKVYTMLGAGILGGYGANEAKGDGAYEIKAINYTDDLSFTIPPMYIRGFNDANEIFDFHDGSFGNSAGSKVLEISSNEPGFRATINAKPLNTPESDMDLATKYNIAGTVKNKLRVKVTNNGGLDHRRVFVYDAKDPNTQYEIPIDGLNHDVNLPDLVNTPAGKYATWKVETPALVPGDIASSSEVGILDGKVDMYDVLPIFEEWLKETFEGENYSWSDISCDGFTNLEDFVISARNYNSQ